MKHALVTCLGSVLLCSCASMLPQQRHVTLSSTFSPTAVAWFNEKGTGAIDGQAFFQTRGGQPRTCAGLQIALEPQSAYGDERLLAIYGNLNSGYVPAAATLVQFSPDDPAYKRLMKTTVCDAQGNFSFVNLPAGKYFVVAVIAWNIPGTYGLEGGALMKSVSLDPAEKKRVILTP
jgi:hypothetical protein